MARLQRRNDGRANPSNILEYNIRGLGTVVLKTQVIERDGTSRESHMTLNNVLYVPSSPCNILKDFDQVWIHVQSVRHAGRAFHALDRHGVQVGYVEYGRLLFPGQPRSWVSQSHVSQVAGHMIDVLPGVHQEAQWIIHATAAALYLDPHFPSSDPNTPTKPVFNDKKEEWLRTRVPGGLEHLLRRLHLCIEVEGDAQLGRRLVRAVIPLTQHALDTINDVESGMDVHLSEEIGLAVQSLMADPPDFDFTSPVDPSAMPKYTTSDLKLIRSRLGSVWAAIQYFNLDNPPEKSPAEIEEFDLEFRLAYFDFRRQEQEYVDGRRSGHIAGLLGAMLTRKRC